MANVPVKNLVVTSVETGEESEPLVISFNVEEDGKDLQFKLLQTQMLTKLSVGVHDYGTIIVPQSAFQAGTRNIILRVELRGSVTGEYNANFSLTNIITVGAYVALTSGGGTIPGGSV